ncbi:MAG: PQQ-like beta-propeller repeat protein [Bacteroidia bacterium]|nr:PQQ-like beta-propeller repeat protein [Bacteroidia bacterium]
MKKPLIITGIIVVVVAASAIFGYKFIKKVIAPTVSAAIYAVPIDAAFVFQSNNFYETIRKTEHESAVWQELINIPGLRKANKNIAFLDSLFRLSLKAKELIRNKSMTISAHLIGEDHLEYLFLAALPESVGIDEINNLIGELVKDKATIKTRNYNNAEIYDVHFAHDKNMDFFYTLKKGIFILSFYSIILENSVRQLDTQISFLSDRGYKKVQKTAGRNVDATLYINYREFPRLMLLSSNKKNKDDVISFKNLACWTEFDLSIKKDAVLLNGFTYTNDSSNNYLNIFLKQSPQTITLAEILPGNTSAFIALGFSNMGRFNTDYRRYIEFSGQGSSFTKEMSRIKKECGIEIEKMIYPLIDKEIGVAFTGVEENEDIVNNAYAIIKTVNKTQAEEEFLKLLANYATNNGKEESFMKINFNIDDQTSFMIYKMPYPSLIRRLFGSMFSKVDADYFTFLDNYMIFGKSQKALGEFIHSIILQKTLGDDKNYKQFIDNFSGKSNFLFYSNVARSPILYASFLNDDLKKIITDNTATFQKFQAVAYQFYSMNDMLYNNIYFKYNPVYKDEPKTIWEAKIDTFANFRPVLVENFTNDEKCIFVQDAANNVYLINSVGNKKWKVNVKEKIMSNVFQIDYFKNKKIQFLFSTKNYIYILDVLGNDVKNFPLQLRSPATNGVSLIDYEKKKNYRLFIAGEDKKIYAYTKEGGVLKEWKFTGTDNPVKSMIQFVELDKKDQLVFSDSRKTYITDRKGNVKIKLNKEFPRSANNIFYLNSDKKQTSLVTTDTSGTVKFISSEGKVTNIILKKYSGNHYFIFDDMNGDGAGEFIFADKNKIDVYKQNKKLIYSKELEGAVSASPVIFEFTKKTHKMGAVCADINRIYLLNSNGSVYNGFPLAGKTMFSIGYFTKSSDNFNLVVGSADHFIYNYEIK